MYKSYKALHGVTPQSKGNATDLGRRLNVSTKHGLWPGATASALPQSWSRHTDPETLFPGGRHQQGLRKPWSASTRQVRNNQMHLVLAPSPTRFRSVLLDVSWEHTAGGGCGCVGSSFCARSSCRRAYMRVAARLEGNWHGGDEKSAQLEILAGLGRL